MPCWRVFVLHGPDSSQRPRISRRVLALQRQFRQHSRSLPLNALVITNQVSSRMVGQPEPIRGAGLMDCQLPNCPFDRHRGGGHPPTPATPPCVRVRTRRFELVTLTPIDQRWKSERFEVSVGKPNREGFGPSEVPGAASTTGRVASQSRTNSQFPVVPRGDGAVFSIAAT